VSFRPSAGIPARVRRVLLKWVTVDNLIEATEVAFNPLTAKPQVFDGSRQEGVNIG
jgi:hypothetical protein